MSDICKIINFPSGPKTLNKYVVSEGWSVGEKVTGKRRETTLDEDFFKKWTRNSAWAYGWLLTDGSVDIKSGQIRLMLNSQDRDVLIKLKNGMQYSGKVYDGEQRDGRKYSYLRVCRREMVADLADLGMAMQNKTFNTSVPELPETLFRDFLRGITEGDGSIKHGKQWNDLQVSICSATESFLVDVQTELLKRGIHATLKEHLPGTSGRKNYLYTLTTKSNADALRWCIIIYGDTSADMRLNRKFDIFTNYVRGYYDRNRRSRACISLIEEIKRTIPECFETPPQAVA